ncbi:MAG: HDOD domain-containing protein [Thermodesulfobacteriota bacterium]|nr:HDOD domain-containing protein [Thermodesulfobacteriota bacterium]
MHTYIARQPIFQRDKKIYGYELLFRDGIANAFPGIDGNEATSRVLLGSFMGGGIELFTGDSLAFINFTRELIVNNVAAGFSPDQVVIEVLEDVEPDNAVIAASRRIREQGFSLALDDFFYKPEFESLLSLATIIKIDIQQTPLHTITDLVSELAHRDHLTLLAEKVETYDEFQQAIAMGFSLFQGYFFSKPEVLKQRDILPSKFSYLRFVMEVNKQDVDFGKLETVITQDVAMSFKLFRYINSPYFRRVCEIHSVRHALTILGERETRNFISVIALSNLADEKPNELIRTAIFRARFCELLGRHAGSMGIKPETLFLVGLFSVIDAILDNTMENLMAQLPFSGEIKSALVERAGPLGAYLNITIGCEAGDWFTCLPPLPGLKIDESKIPDDYLNALQFADAYMGK